ERVGSADGGIGACRPGASHAAADHVWADDEVAIRINGLLRSDHGFPPSGAAGDRMRAGYELVAAQSMADEDGIRAGAVQLPVGLVSESKGREGTTAIERQRRVDGKRASAIGGGRKQRTRKAWLDRFRHEPRIEARGRLCQIQAF